MKNELYIVTNRGLRNWWFTLNKEEAIRVQQENISNWKSIIEEELTRIENINN